jgi:amino acid transporter
VATVFCYRLLGNAGILIASLILMTSVLGSANGNILIGPRLFVAMGRDGLIPQWLYRVNEKYGTPAAATVTFSTWAALLIVIGGLLTHVQLPMVMGVDLNLSKDKELFDVLTDYAMVGQILMGTLACAAIFPLRMRNAEEVPYRCPLYPALPIVYCVVMAAVFLNMYFSDSKRTEAWIGTGFLIIGLMVYELFYRRRG